MLTGTTTAAHGLALSAHEETMSEKQTTDQIGDLADALDNAVLVASDGSVRMGGDQPRYAAKELLGSDWMFEHDEHVRAQGRESALRHILADLDAADRDAGALFGIRVPSSRISTERVRRLIEGLMP